MKRGLLPSHLVICGALIPENFSKRLEAFKIETGLSWDDLAAWIGVDPRQLQRWRKGTKPSGDGIVGAHRAGGSHTRRRLHVVAGSRCPARRPFSASSGIRIRHNRGLTGSLSHGSAETGLPTHRIRISA